MSQPSSRRLIVHLGLQKTGSTSLHHFLQKNAAALEPRLQILTPRRESPTRAMGRIAALFSLDPAREGDFTAAIAAVRAEIGADSRPVTLISHENLPGAMPGRGGTATLYPALEEIVARLDTHLAPFVPEYALFTRDMGAWKRSVWGQAVRSDGYAEPFETFLAETADCGTWESLGQRLRAAAPGRAHVFALEDEPDPARPGTQLLRLAGLSEAEISALAPQTRSSNTALNSGSLEFLRLLNSLKLDREPRRRVAELAIRNQALFVST